MLKISDLTQNELAATVTLMQSCLDGMGGSTPADLYDDRYTWVAASDLVDRGWSNAEAAGTLGALEEKELVFLDGNDSTASDSMIEFCEANWATIKDVVREPVKSKPQSKKQMMEDFILENPRGRARKTVIDHFMKEHNMTKASASTTYQNAKKALNL